MNETTCPFTEATDVPAEDGVLPRQHGFDRGTRSITRGELSPRHEPGGETLALARGPSLFGTMLAFGTTEMTENTRPWILLVDDHDDGRELVHEFLSLKNYGVEPCSSAEQALVLVQSKGIPDAVLTDLQLGSMTGADLANAIRAMPCATNVPIVAMTGRAEFDDTQRLFDAVLIKPTELSVLVATLDAAIASKR